MLAMLFTLLRFLIALLLITVTLAYVKFDLIEAVARHILQLAISKKIGTSWSCEALVLRYNSIEFRGVLVANGPGTWEAPFSLRFRRIRIQWSGLVAWLSLFPQLTAGFLRLGALEFSLGFRVREFRIIVVDVLREQRDGAHRHAAADG